MIHFILPHISVTSQSTPKLVYINMSVIHMHTNPVTLSFTKREISHVLEKRNNAFLTVRHSVRNIQANEKARGRDCPFAEVTFHCPYKASWVRGIMTMMMAVALRVYRSLYFSNGRILFETLEYNKLNVLCCRLYFSRKTLMFAKLNECQD